MHKIYNKNSAIMLHVRFEVKIIQSKITKFDSIRPIQKRNSKYAYLDVFVGDAVIEIGNDELGTRGRGSSGGTGGGLLLGFLLLPQHPLHEGAVVRRLHRSFHTFHARGSVVHLVSHWEC
jgi:hypothetical protein